jgi:phage-related protein/predicted XRE-type DNA-binding protein
MKLLKFVGSSLDDLRDFPEEARRTAGFELRTIQNGLEPRDWKPVGSVGSGVREIRIHVLGEWRIIYVANIRDAIYVLHAFQKKTQKTSQRDIELARKRYKQIGEWFMKKSIVASSGNVFIDLGYSKDEAAILQMRADLMADIRKFIKTKKLTQAEAAKIFGVSQSRVSDLITGKWEKFSLEMLIILVTKAGMHVKLKIAA